MSATKAITIKSLKNLTVIDEAIIESLDQMLYRLLIKVDEQWLYVSKNGHSLLSRNILDLQKLLMGKTLGSLQLKHSSAYDEMIGLDTKPGQNTLTVPLGMPKELLQQNNT